MSGQQSASSVNIVLPILTLLIGLVAGWIKDWLDFRRVRRKEREDRAQTRWEQVVERRAIFQRQTLLDLQEAIMSLVRSVSQVHIVDIRNYRQTGKWQKQLVGDELSEQCRLNHARVNLLRVRVRDRRARELVEALTERTSRLTNCTNETEGTQILRDVMNVFNQINHQIGQLLRELDDELMKDSRSE